MIAATPHMRILLAVAPVDFRKGIDGLAAVCRQKLREDPFAGHVFVFRNKKGNAIRLLMYDGQGFRLCQKRLSKGRFAWWPDKTGGRLNPLAVHEPQLLIWKRQPGQSAGGSPVATDPKKLEKNKILTLRPASKARSTG